MELTNTAAGIRPMSAKAIAKVAQVERELLACQQLPIHTHHVLHAGMYSRTITIPANVTLTGALIKRATMLVISGDVLVLVGEKVSLRIVGTQVLPASAGRKQIFRTFADTSVTMMFPTTARTVEEAEAEFTDEAHMLLSHRDPECNTITITGEQ